MENGQLKTSAVRYLEILIMSIGPILESRLASWAREVLSPLWSMIITDHGTHILMPGVSLCTEWIRHCATLCTRNICRHTAIGGLDDIFVVLQLRHGSTLEQCRIVANSTLEAHPLLCGGGDTSKLSAAKRAELEHERRERKRISDENYARWFACADLTQPGATGGDAVMRLVKRFALLLFSARFGDCSDRCLSSSA